MQPLRSSRVTSAVTAGSADRPAHAHPDPHPLTVGIAA